MSESQLMTVEAPQVAPPQMAPVTPMTLIHMALQGGANLDAVERLVALQERTMAHDAEMAFNAAMSSAQSAMTTVRQDATNPQTRSKYASYAALDRAVRPIYSREGLALSFNTGECPTPEYMRLLCYVSHPAGYTRTYHLDMPADGKGAKGGDVMTKTHAVGSAAAYGMRYLLKMIFNIAVGEDDRDGNPVQFDTTPHMDAMAKATSRDDLQAIYEPAYRAARAAKDTAAQVEITKGRDERWRLLK